ncbi:MAG: YopX family protein [Nanoarchaeota archaeon]
MREIKFRIWDEKYHSWAPNSLMVYPTNIICQGRIFQQFIGLFDKNNKPIYEGDIVKYVEKMYEHGDSQTLVAEVYYDEEFAAFGLKGKETWNYFTDMTIGHFEVIGNVFENVGFLA